MLTSQGHGTRGVKHQLVQISVALRPDRDNPADRPIGRRRTFDQHGLVSAGIPIDVFDVDGTQPQLFGISEESASDPGAADRKQAMVADAQGLTDGAVPIAEPPDHQLCPLLRCRSTAGNREQFDDDGCNRNCLHREPWPA